MSEYPNSGSLFEAETPKKTDTHPDREGSAEITCPHCNQKSDWWVNGWIKKSAKTGNRFLSLAFKVKQPKVAKQNSFEDRMADDGNIPF